MTAHLYPIAIANQDIVEIVHTLKAIADDLAATNPDAARRLVVLAGRALDKVDVISDAILAVAR